MPDKKPILFRTCNHEEFEEPSPAVFEPDDVTGCFALDCEKAPEFRLIELRGDGSCSGGESYEAGVSITLLCRECAVEETRGNLEVMDGSVESDIPTLGFMLLPLHLESQHVADLRAEITPEILTSPKPENPQ